METAYTIRYCQTQETAQGQDQKRFMTILIRIMVPLRSQRELRKTGENISERTVGKYMKQMGIKAQWIRPWTVTTKDSDFSNELQKYP